MAVRAKLEDYLPRGFKVVPINGGVQLVAPDSGAAEDLHIGAKKHLMATADHLCGVVQIAWKGCKEPLEIKPSIMAALGKATGDMLTVNAATIAQIQNADQSGFWRSSKLPVLQPLLSVMGRMIEADRPMFLLANDTDDQLWINQLACDMIQSSGNDAVRRCMRNYWNAPDLEALHHKLRDTSQPFEHEYRAILNDENPDTWFEAVSRYEPVEVDGRSFRLSVNQQFRIIGRSDQFAPMRHV